MDIQEVRKIFSKGLIATRNRSITATYVFKERWFAQSIDSNNKESLISLLHSSDDVIICASENKYIRFAFNGDFQNESCIYNPLDKEVTDEELKEIIENCEIIDPYGIYEAFKDVDFSNGYEVSETFKEIFKENNDRNKDNISFESISKWKGMADIINNINILTVMNVSDPHEDGNVGYFECSVNVDRPVGISGETKMLFEKLLLLSSELCIEGNVNNAELIFTFFL